MSSAAALPWILAAAVGTAGLSIVLFLGAWIDQREHAIAQAELRTLDAADSLLTSLQPIVAEGEPLLQAASIGPVSPELIQAVGDFRRKAEAALRDTRRQPRQDEALRRLDLGADELVHAAELAISAVSRLHAGAAYEPGAIMHGEARHANARLSDLGAKMADASVRIAAHRKARLSIMTRSPLPLPPIFGWRAQAWK